MKTEPGNGRVDELTFVDDSLEHEGCRDELGDELGDEFSEELYGEAQESERFEDLSEQVFDAHSPETHSSETQEILTDRESAEAEEIEESAEWSALVPSSVELPELRAELRRLERTGRSSGEPFRSGLARLDAALPDGGLLPGSLVEWLIAGPGTGCAALSMTWIREACRRRDGLVVLIDRQGTWYPPALAAWGLSLDRLLWVRPADVADECWAIDQALRSPGVAVVWAEARRLDPRWGRRFRAAAEAGGALGFFECSPDASGRAAWSDLQLKIKPRPRVACSTGDSRQNWWFRVEVVRGRGRVRGLQLDVELDGITGELREQQHQQKQHDDRTERYERTKEFRPPHSVTLASRLAHPTPRRRSARA